MLGDRLQGVLVTAPQGGAGGVALRTAAILHPSIIINGSPDAQMTPSHLISLGFYLLRARTQMEEVANILLK